MSARPYRSDLAGRLAHFVHHRPATVAAAVMIVILVPVWVFA